MAAGEGIKQLVLAGAAIGGLAWLFIEAGAWVGRHWTAMIDADLGPPHDERDLTAEAMIPEYAAARRPCNCRACRTRANHEPCSDFDGD